MGPAILDRSIRDVLLPSMVGAGVPRLTGWGEVVSCFAGAVNIRRKNGLLVSLVQDLRAMTYLSLCVPALFRNQDKRLVTGDRVRFGGHCVSTGDFIVDLLGQPTWQGTITPEDVKGFDVAGISVLKQILLLKGKDGGFLGLLRRDQTDNPFVSKARQVLSCAGKAESRAAGLDFLSGLVGLGPGSTPSGDDFICGVLLGEETRRLLLSGEAKAVAHGLDLMLPWSAEKTGLRLALKKTNDAGKTLLRQGLQGRFPNYLIEAVRSMSEAKGKQEIADAVEIAVSRGATSGTDALVGLVFCLEKSGA